MVWYFDTGRTGYDCQRETTIAAKVEICYELGGMSYFSGSSKPRGYYVYMQYVELGGGFEKTSISFGGRKSGYKLVEEAPRFSARTLPRLEGRAAEIVAEYAEAIATANA